jgi:EAL domain-containing protein (putative c-di-GMP-specific phosphodiesterase class I)
MRLTEPDRRAPRLTELRFQYQPIVSLSAGEPGWSEALVRWQLPDGTVRGPLDILPHWLSPNRHAEFTRFCVERAAAVIAANREALVSINLSPAQIMHPATIQALEGLLPTVRSRLRIELTEQRVYDMGALWGNLGLVRDRCGLVLLDDVTLDDLDLRTKAGAPIDGIKVDRSVILRLADSEDRPRIEAFLKAATQRFAIVVAEGIEDTAICEGLRELGVSHVQGFAIAKPRNELTEPLYEPGLPGHVGPDRRVLRRTFGENLAGGSHAELNDH